MLLRRLPLESFCVGPWWALYAHMCSLVDSFCLVLAFGLVGFGCLATCLADFTAIKTDRYYF
jgi:hypothetical protein